MSSGAGPDAGGGRLLLDEPAPGIARLTISNPRRRGALDHAILDGFVSLLARLDHLCVIVTGEPGIFSAGYDISSLPDDGFAAEAEARVAHPFDRAIAALESYPHPTVAALTGHAIGGGLELALACDLRVAVAGATLGMPPAKLGLVYSHTGIQRFISVVGAARTRELFLVGRRIDARTAHRWGLVNEVVEPDALTGHVLDLARETAGNAPLSIAGNKRVINALVAAGDRLDRDVERDLMALREACFHTADFREGVRAFEERRPPRWTGR